MSAAPLRERLEDGFRSPQWSEWAGILAVAVIVPIGLALVYLADTLSFRGSSLGGPLYWAGLVIIFAPAVAVLWPTSASRRDALGVVLVVALALYAVKILHSPAGLGGYDELLHYRTLDDLFSSGRLFSQNILLPISPFYPGLEIVTASLMKVTGIGIFPAAIIVIGVVRVLMVLSIFLLFERIADPPRLAGMAALAYMACPSFISFDAQFAYESLALPMTAFALFAFRAAQLDEGEKRFALNVFGIAASLAVVVTHHVTSFILLGTLVMWTVLTLAFRRVHREPVPGGPFALPVLITAVTAWVLTVAREVVGYLWPHVVWAVSELMRIVAGESTSRRLFESNAGISAPILERLVGLGSVALVVGCIPFGLWYLWKRQRTQPMAWLIALGAVAYPAMMALRFTKSGWDIASRATAFVYIPLALVLVAGLEWLRTSQRMRWLVWTPLLVLLAVIIFTGGVVAGTSPSTRLPQPYRAGSGEISIDAEVIAAAEWARDTLGPNNRIAADSTNASVMGSYGRQRPVTSADNVSITGLFLAPGLGTYQDEIIKKGGIHYVVIDRRIAGVVPLKGYFYEKWEHDLVNYGSKVSTDTLARFDQADEVSRIYDSGDIQIYDVSRLAR